MEEGRYPLVLPTKSTGSIHIEHICDIQLFLRFIVFVML